MECELMKGITIDRTYHSVPQLPNFHSEDVALIKSMGFDFIKLVINPAVHKSGNTVVNMDYINSIVDKVISQDMHAVLCIHPERSFKNLVFQDKKEFRDLCQWYERFAGQLSQKWSDKELVFQLMTEPFGTSPDPDAWNCWNKLQPPMWETFANRCERHTQECLPD